MFVNRRATGSPVVLLVCCNKPAWRFYRTLLRLMVPGAQATLLNAKQKPSLFSPKPSDWPFIFNSTFSAVEITYNRFLYALFVVPVANNMNAPFFGVYPAIPHDLYGHRSSLYYAQCIHLPTPPVIFFTAVMGIGF